MSEENKNHFIYRQQFPDWKSILSRKGKSINEISKNALFVLDTNTLLVPYNTGKDNLNEIEKKYEKLVSEDRLFVPEHALLEFAKNRSSRIQDLFTQIDNQLSTLPSMKVFEYPILEQLDPYKKLNISRSEISKQIKEYKKYLEDLRDGIIDWNWSDPVTKVYQNTFSEKCIINPLQNEEQLIKEYNERIKNEIPPGNKDKAKENNAIGDFLIWKSILELGKSKKKDIIFVSNDEKNDWLLKGNKKSISTKFELVDEYYRYSEGYNFISINFARFLEIQGLEIDIIETFNYDNNYHNFNKTFYFNTFNTYCDQSKHSFYAAKALKNIVDYITEFLDRCRLNEHIISINEEDFAEYITAFVHGWKNEFSDFIPNEKTLNKLLYLERLILEIKVLNDKLNGTNGLSEDFRTVYIKLVALCEDFIKAISYLNS